VQPHHKYYYDVPQVGDFMGEGDCDSEGCIMTRVETSKSFYGLGTLRSNVRQCLFVGLVGVHQGEFIGEFRFSGVRSLSHSLFADQH